jgi:uncharacterized membrane protein YhaH (DUF805 family)
LEKVWRCYHFLFAKIVCRRSLHTSTVLSKDIEEKMAAIPTSSPTVPATLSPEDGAVVLGFLAFVLFLLLLPFILHVVAYRQGCFEEFMKVVKLKAKDFSSRSRRKEYIGFSVANWLLSYDFSFLDARFGTTFNPNSGVGVFWLLYTILIIIPHLAVSVRRMHDTGRSGAWLFLFFVPIVGPLAVLVILTFFDSQVGDNLYGPNPKGVAYHEPAVNAEYVPVHVAQEMSVASTATTGAGDAPLLTQSGSMTKSIEPYRGGGNDDEDSRTNLV